MKKNSLYLVIIISFISASFANKGPYDLKEENEKPYFIQRRGNRYFVKPKMIDSVLINPGMGFTTFQRFNGDTLNPETTWTEGFPIDYQEFEGSVENNKHPQTTIAYWRIYWQYLEPEEDNYRWDMLDRALDTARERGQTLMIRIAPYGTGKAYGPEDVPAWYRNAVGDNTTYEVARWMVDPEDPGYALHFGELIREFGHRYDGHPDLELVDVSIVGAWGEGDGTGRLSEGTRRSLFDAYIESFKTTPLVAQPKSLEYINSKAKIGWRVDCMGDLGFRSRSLEGWNHMTDYYPFQIIGNSLQENWIHSPVSFEIGRTFHYWKDSMNYSIEDVRYIIDESLKWHVSTFNTKSCPVPDDEAWWSEINRWLKKMGYRICLRRLTYPVEIKSGGLFSITSWWENKGVAPCYRNYLVAFRLKSDKYEHIIKTDIDITNWLPGDHLYDDSFRLPDIMPAGDYDLNVAILDSNSGDPKVRLGIAGRQSDGWYPLGMLTIED